MGRPPYLPLDMFWFLPERAFRDKEPPTFAHRPRPGNGILFEILEVNPGEFSIFHYDGPYYTRKTPATPESFPRAMARMRLVLQDYYRNA